MILTESEHHLDEQAQLATRVHEVDCAEPGRTCYLRVLTDWPDPIRIPIHFSPTE